MRPRHTHKTASCLYMLGFLSGLVFVVLCGSSALYEGATNSLANSGHQNEQSVDMAPEEVLPQPELQNADNIDISFTRSAEGDKLLVKGVYIEPDTPVQVRLQNGEQVLDSKSAIADENSTFAVEFLLSETARSLTHVDVIVEYDTIKIPKSYPLPSDVEIGSTATDTPQPMQSATTIIPTDTPTPSATPTLPPSPTIVIPTLTPTITPTPLPTPIPMEPYYPNWRAEYYNNATWANAPAVVRDDQDIAFNWGESSPAPGAVGENWFSARWTRRVVLPEGYYTFVLSADDQAEVYMNGQELLSYMGKSPSVNQASRYVQGFVPIEFEVKYAEYWGNAHIQFYWQPVGTGPEAGAGCCWTAAYYQGAEIFGEPVLSESIAGNDLHLTWYEMALPIWERVGYRNYFSTRLTREIQAPVQAGNYHLCVYVNDVARLWLDRNQLVYHCACGERSCLVCRQVYLGKNPTHHLNLEYSHTLGEPYLGFYIVPAREGESWVGAFFDNAEMSGLPLVVRTAANVDFNWQQFAPPDTGLYYDHFAVRWQNTVELVHGQYVFHVLVDDGARLQINGRTIIDQWEKGSAREFTATYDVLGEKELAQIELDYYDDEVMAVIKLWWDAPPPTPTPTPTMTPDP